MELTTQKLVHTFGSLADLGQEVADTGDFSEMVRTSLHLLLGTLALRRGGVVECAIDGSLYCVAPWGLEEPLGAEFTIDEKEKTLFLNGGPSAFLLENLESSNEFLDRYRVILKDQSIQVIVPMIVRGELSGFVMLGGKASGEDFSVEDFETIRAMVRHIGVGIHTHRLLEKLARRAEDNRRLYEELRAIYRDTVKAFAAAIDIKDKYTKGIRSASEGIARSSHAKWVGLRRKSKAFRLPAISMMSASL